MKAEQLRRSILQLAIQGKLVPQDPADEPASVLLERIRAEKQRLIKEGKIKKDKGDSVIFKGDDNCYYEKTGSEVKNITDEIPFDIPDSWCWVRLSNFGNISAGGTPDRGNPNYWGGSIPWLKISDITSSKKFVSTCTEFITDEGMNNSSAKLLPTGTILYTIFATIGEVGILTFNATCNQAIAGIQTYLNSIDEYLYYYLVNLQDFMKSLSKGCAQFNINQKILKSALVPFPPLTEQKRIVAEIEKFEPLIAEYDRLEQQATKLDGEIYDKLKKSILQYAIQGKLVPQDSNDEPASVLLERIRAEKKAQLGKKYVESYIYKGDDNCYYEHINEKDVDITEEIPFDLPNGWAWCRISEFSKVLGGKRIPAGRRLIDKNTGYIYIKVSDMKNGTVDLEKLQYVPSDIYPSIKRYIINKEDIYITVAGTIGRVGTIPPELDGANLTENADRLVFRFINQQWLVYCLQSQNTQEQIQDATTKVGQPKLAIVRIEQLLIPLPPLAEQKRIVEKIDEIFAKL